VRITCFFLKTLPIILSNGIIFISFSTSEVAHVQAARLLKVRADLHRRLPLEKFAILHESSNKFLSESETICGRQCYGLRPTVSAQARSYLETFHTNRMNTIRAILEAENWQKAEVACEFPPIFACLLDPEVDLKSVERTSGSTSTGMFGVHHQYYKTFS